MRNHLAMSRFGARVRIREVGGERSFRRRLLELGFLPGVEVRVLSVAPLGDPLQIELRGCRFSLRRAEAQAIRVTEPTTVALPVLANPLSVAK